MATEQARTNSGRWVTGDILGDSKGGFEFEGFNQHLQAGRNGQGMQAAYVVLDYSGIGNSLYSTHFLHASHTDSNTGGLKYLSRSIHFAGSTPYRDSSCWFSPYFACSGGECAHSVNPSTLTWWKSQSSVSLNFSSSFFFQRHGFSFSFLTFHSIHYTGCMWSNRIHSFQVCIEEF